MNKQEIEFAYRYLERVQLAYLKRNGIPLENYYLHEEDLEHFPEEYRDILKNLVWSNSKNLVLSTKYEINYAYQMLKMCVDKVDTPAIKEKITHVFGIKEHDNLLFPIWGTVSSYEFSAEICLVGSKTKLVMISDAVFISAYLLVKIIDNILFPRDDCGMCLFNLTHEYMEKYLNENFIIQQRYNDFMGSMLFCQTPILAKQYFDESSIFRTAIVDGFETFVVAHEYAHSLCGHMNKKYSSLNDINKVSTETEAEMVCHEWEDEFEADIIGAYITLEAIGHNDFGKMIRFMGIYLCMSMLELQEKINEIKLGEVIVSKTHPPGSDRKRLLIEMFFPEGKPRVYDEMDLILDDLWNSFLATLKKIMKTNLKQSGTSASYLSFRSFQERIYNEI